MNLEQVLESQRAVNVACVWEVTARKIGNVHPRADHPGLRYIDLLIAAGAIVDQIGGSLLSRLGQPPVFGLRIRNAVAETRHLTGTNANLGIILLLAPLAAIRFGSRRL